MENLGIAQALILLAIGYVIALVFNNWKKRPRHKQPKQPKRAKRQRRSLGEIWQEHLVTKKIAATMPLEDWRVLQAHAKKHKKPAEFYGAILLRYTESLQGPPMSMPSNNNRRNRQPVNI